MESAERENRREEAARQFNQHENRGDGVDVAARLDGGLTVLRDALYVRLHDDVEMAVGRDSMLLPVSETKTEQKTKAEIELYQIAVSAAAVRRFGYVGGEDDWYLRWLTQFRFGRGQDHPNVTRQLASYSSQSSDEQRLAFTDILARVLPESRKAPLVLFRLVPLAVEIATALAFGDHSGALDARKRQVACLPAIGDCHDCRGKLLENGERCRQCGNPLWAFDWLTAAD